MEWRPIETAPNEQVLLFYPELTKGRRTRPPMIVIGNPKLVFDGATHWMPKPNPPAA